MFQYALGRRMSFVEKVPFKMDIHEFNMNSQRIEKRKYELSIFNIEENFASKKEINRFNTRKQISEVYGRLHR